MSGKTDKANGMANLREGQASRSDAYESRVPDLSYEDFLAPGEPPMQGELRKKSAAKVKRDRGAKGVKPQGDPLKLQGAGKSRAAEGLRRGALIRKSDNLSNIFHRRGIDPKMLRAGLEVRELVLLATGGMQAMDWLRERVDGGKLASTMIGGGAYEAEQELRQIVRKSGMGVHAAEVMIRVCGLDEPLKAVAIDLEHRPSWRAKRKCSPDTQAYVAGLLREALNAAYRIIFPENQPAEELTHRLLLRWWLAEDAVTSDRPDIREKDPRFKAAS